MIAAAISILLWMLVVVGFILLRNWDPEPFSTATYVATMSPTGRDEMCEVWSQDRWSVIQSLRSLGGASVADATLVAGLTCS